MQHWQFVLALAIARTGGLKRWGYNIDGQLPDVTTRILQTNDVCSQNLVSSSTQSQSAVIVLEEAYQSPTLDPAGSQLNTADELNGPSTSTPLGSPSTGNQPLHVSGGNVSPNTSLSRKRRLFDVQVSPIDGKQQRIDGCLLDSGADGAGIAGMTACAMDQAVPDNATNTVALTSPNRITDDVGNVENMPVTPPPRPRINLHKTPAPVKSTTPGLNATNNSEYIGNVTTDTQATEYCFNGKVPEKNGSKTRQFWNEALARQSTVLRLMTSSSLSRISLVAHAVESWKILNITYDSFMIRSSELYDGIQCFASNALKLYEFLILRGCEEVSSLPHEFVKAVLSRYLSSPTYMHEYSRNWISSREIITLICSQLTNLDIQMSLLALLNEIQLKFLSRWSTGSNVPFERNDNFVTYCLCEITGLINHCKQRVCQINKRQRYSLLC